MEQYSICRRLGGALSQAPHAQCARQLLFGEQGCAGLVERRDEALLSRAVDLAGWPGHRDRPQDALRADERYREATQPHVGLFGIDGIPALTGAVEVVAQLSHCGYRVRSATREGLSG